MVAEKSNNFFEERRAVMVGEMRNHLDTYADGAVVHLAGMLIEELAERCHDTIHKRGYSTATTTTAYGQARGRQQVPMQAKSVLALADSALHHL